MRAKSDLQNALDTLEARGLIVKVGNRYFTPENAPYGGLQ